MNISKAIEILTIGIKAQKPILLVGSPGIGKTDIVGQVAKSLKMELETLHPIVSDPTDFKGLPANVDGKAEFLPYGNLRRLVEATKPTLAFIDDLGAAPMAVQAAAMHLLLAREVNGTKISDKVSFVAATNSRKDRAGVTGLISPLVNRFTVVEVEPTVQDFCDWGLSQGNTPLELIAYLQYRPDLFNKYKPSMDIENFPSPRGIASAGDWIKLGITDSETLGGACGKGFAADFCAFYARYKNLAGLPEQVVLDPKGAKVPEEASEKYSITCALGGRVDESSFDNCILYMGRISEEFTTLFLKVATTRNPELTATDSFINYLVKKNAKK